MLENTVRITCKDILIELLDYFLRIAKILNQKVYSFYILEYIARQLSSKTIPIYCLTPVNESTCFLRSWPTLYFVSLYLKEHHAVYIYIFISCEVNIHVHILIFYLVILIYTFVNCLFMVSVHFSIGMFTFSIDSWVLFTYQA